jgi:hypothetical protein
MIRPDEIKVKALKWWESQRFLQAYAAGEDFFPRDIPFRKISSREAVTQFSSLSQEIKQLREKSKENTGSGYRLELTEINTQKIGRQLFPTRIYFEQQEDYLKFIGKEKEFRSFVSLKKLIAEHMPELTAWVNQHPGKVIQEEEHWLDLLKVCRFFLSNPKPGLYIRELPIAVHTKFIEEHKQIISELLTHLLGEELINPEFTGLRNNNFEKRFHLKYDESMVRFRILDPMLNIRGLSDLSLLPQEFASLHFDCRKVFITENKMNCLTFPAVKNAIIIFGTGYGVKKLKQADWLREKEIIYWGDIDAHGFEILSQLRSYFPQTISFLMNQRTFKQFYAFSCRENSSFAKQLPHLNTDEQEMYTLLSNSPDNNRLEQEKIDQQYVMAAVEQLL